MATRTKKIKECDRAGCLNTRDVAFVALTMNGGPERRHIAETSGDLCPVHVRMVGRFMDNLFKNTKQYDEPAPASTD
ncbi:hypothetical protein LCGC14_0686020 [marine sediment metagenome]|uniref:Uncharacterized protein n=1 Tax=marine sediment metagenome TaxID=412755 RepID=A0A0F9QRQ0_9ZZZZ